MSEGAMLRPEEVRADYNRTVQSVQGNYIQFRWLSSPTQRRHYAQTQAALTGAVRHLQPGRLLEVGCGPAVWTPLLLSAATEATLLDISDDMLAGAREALKNRTNISFVRADFADAVLEPGSFDSVVSIRAFEYMPDKPRMFEQFAHCLRPGGRFLLVTKNAGWEDHRRAQATVSDVPDEAAARALRLQAGVSHWESLKPMAAAAGFREITVYPAVVGSYRPFLRNQAALLGFDLVHRSVFRKPMTRQLDRWTESVLLLATR